MNVAPTNLDTMRLPMALEKSGATSARSASTEGLTDLQAEAAGVLDRLRLAVKDVIAAIPQPIRRGADLARALDIDSVLAWNLFRISTSPESLAAASFVPGGGTLKHFLRAAEKCVPADVVERVAEAFAAYEACVKKHAPDRAAFNAMIGDLHGQDTNKEDLKNKRAAYRAQRYLYGLHSDAYLVTSIVKPSENSTPDHFHLDVARISGNQRIQRTRRLSTLISESTFRLDKPGKRNVTPRMTTALKIDPKNPDLIVTPLEQYCSHPLPEIRFHNDASGATTIEAHGEGLGSQDALTFYYASIDHGTYVPFYPLEPIFTFFSNVLEPTEVLVRDIWLHESVWPGAKATVEIFKRHQSEFTLRAENLLPFNESIVQLGRGAGVSASSDIPRYPEMVSDVAARLGWNLDEFRLYRCRIEYPVLNSLVRVVFRIAPSPGQSTVP